MALPFIELETSLGITPAIDRATGVPEEAIAGAAAETRASSSTSS
jgi:hypothetical protein